MLSISFIRENRDLVLSGLKKKRLKEADALIEEVISLDNKRKKTQKERDDVQFTANSEAKKIGTLIKEGNISQAEGAKKKAGALKSEVQELESLVGDIEEELKLLLYKIPNIPHQKVPEGSSADDNIEIFREGDISFFEDKNLLPHWDLLKKYDLADFDLGNKVTGAGFPFYKGKGAKLQRGLIQFFLDQAEQEGYLEIQPPILINEESGYATGQLPDKEGQMYHLQNENYYLIPTAEVPITNMLRKETVREEEIPLKFCGYTPCFRREAGSWGANVRGLNRLHQFDKVEIVEIHKPEESYEALERMSEYIEGLIRKLELPFRKLLLCGGDISFNAALCYDMEVYSGAQKRWLEVSSVSNFESYQANRMNLKYKDKSGKSHLAHTLNGSGLALPRIVAAILENGQTKEGISIPEVLVDYCGFKTIS